MGYTTCPLTPEDCTLYNLTRLASKLGVSYDYVKDMKKMGFELPYGGMTTLTHALNWINANPNFRSDARILKCSVRPKSHEHPQRPASGRYDSPRLKRGSRSSSLYSLESLPESVG
jgi:hypothetical protein